jgi:hypothetical protein
MRTLGLLVVLLGACTTTSSPEAGAGSDAPGADTAATDTAATDTAATDAPAADVPGADAGPPAPIVAQACDGDGTCEGTETCAACPDECGSCAIDRWTEQRAKYIDPTCAVAGDGLVDACATSAGGPGRFNELQAAIDSLRAGDTLYVYPGDYFRDRTGTREYEGTYTVHGASSGTAERPVIITARFPDEPPTLHSCDPEDPALCPTPALSTHGEEAVHHVIFDHLRIRGRAQLFAASDSVMQFMDCSHGWGACGDGNWSCLRMDACTDCAVRLSHVHDVAGDGECGACGGPGTCSGGPDRGSGLKEFASLRSMWELNTVEEAPRWGWDHHRNSNDMTVRFNVFRDVSSAIHSERGRNHHIYGNVILAREACVDLEGVNEASVGPHVDEVHHNTCGFAALGVSIDPMHEATLEGNATFSLPAGGTEAGNVNAPSAMHALDCNAYDANSYYHRGLYDGGEQFETLEAWRALGHDATSIAAPGGACTFVDPPSSIDDATFDLHVASGPCLSLGCDGGEVGAYGAINCVGHTCL